MGPEDQDPGKMAMKNKKRIFSVLWVRILIRKICMFIGLPNPSLFVVVRIRILYQQAKKVRLISTIL
jgi:hypothetical protein